MNNPNKLWCECSKEEHREVRNWEARLKRKKKAFADGKLTNDQFQAELKALEKELDEIEERYND